MKLPKPSEVLKEDRKNISKFFTDAWQQGEANGQKIMQNQLKPKMKPTTYFSFKKFFQVIIDSPKLIGYTLVIILILSLLIYLLYFGIQTS